MCNHLAVYKKRWCLLSCSHKIGLQLPVRQPMYPCAYLKNVEDINKKHEQDTKTKQRNEVNKRLPKNCTFISVTTL